MMVMIANASKYRVDVLANALAPLMEKIVVDTDTIRQLITAAERNIADSKIIAVSTENRFDAAYRQSCK